MGKIQRQFEYHIPFTFLVSFLAGFVLFSSTVWVWYVVDTAAHDRLQSRFDERVKRVENAIRDRLNAYEHTLRSGVALHNASVHVDRNEWRAFTTGLRAEKEYPGLLGIGFAEIVQPHERESHTDRIRSEGFPDYRMWPEGNRELYSSIIFLEPFDDRNRRAFGYDMMSNPLRKRAMERARSHDIASLTGKIVLVQETDEDVQAGFLLYLPVYKKNVPLTTVDQRRAAAIGWVYSPFRANDFVTATLGSHQDLFKELAVTIHDGAIKSDDHLLFKDTRYTSTHTYDASFALDHNGHIWTIGVGSLPLFDSYLNENSSRILLVSGVIISFLGMGLVYFLVNRRSQALILTESIKASLGESEARFKKAFESAGHGAALIDLDGSFQDVNTTLCDMLKRDREALLASNLSLLVHPDDSDDLTTQLKSTSVGDFGSLQLETRLVTDEQTAIPVMLSIGIVKDKADKPLSYIAQFTNLTFHKDTEAKYLQAQKMEAVGNLTGGVAHDFNNILGIILGNLQLLERRMAHDVKLTKFVTTAIAATHRGADLTRQLLAFSRRQELEPTALDANDFVSNMDTLLRRTLGENIEIAVNLAEDLGRVMADPAQLEMAILNLAINARDAMPEGGRLHIETSNEEIDAGYVSKIEQAEVGHHVCISVTDTGIGIPMELQETIFQPFYTTKDVGKGTGLGLSMIYGFVRQSGGHIAVYSEVGIGTCFRLYLPRTDEVVADSLYIAEHELRYGHETVLLVEDDEGVRSTAMMLLEELGYTVIPCCNGPDALQKLEDIENVDILFTDMVMPGGINGHELADHVCSIRTHIPVLLTSGYPRDAFAEGRRYPLLQKPYTKEQLSRAIEEALGTVPPHS